MRSVSILIGLCLLKVLLSANLCYRNVLINGDFEQNGCFQNWCIFNRYNCAVPGWIARNELQTGLGTFYHQLFPNSRVIQLDAHENTCVAQILRVVPGLHYLQFDYAARQNYPVETSQFKVYFNGKQIYNISPQDHNKVWIKIPIQVDYFSYRAELKFCGTGPSDRYGAIIDNVGFESQLPC